MRQIISLINDIEDEEQQMLIAEAFYHYIKQAKSNGSVQKNLEAILANCDEQLKDAPDLSVISRGGLPLEVDHLNQVHNQKAQMTLLLDNLAVYGPFLEKLGMDPNYREKAERDLDKFLFEPPGFTERLMDTLVRMFGNSLGWHRR